MKEASDRNAFRILCLLDPIYIQSCSSTFFIYQIHASKKKTNSGIYCMNKKLQHCAYTVICFYGTLSMYMN